MDGLAALWTQTDAVGRAVGLALLAMSILSWVLILWKSWLLARVRRDLARALPHFWQATDLTQGRDRLAAIDREGVTLPLVDAVDDDATPGSLQAAGSTEARRTRRLRDALQSAVTPLHAGQAWLASIGSTAPFVGLFGTVWAIQQALVGLGAGATDAVPSLERVAGPVGEALVMTGAGLAVAIPAVLAYNLLGQRVALCEAVLEGFAQDLRDLPMAGTAAGAPADQQA